MDSSNSQRSYRSLHEAFVSNHTGTSPLEIFSVLMPSVFGSLLIQVLNAKHLQWMDLSLVRFFVEFVVLIVTQVLTVTLIPEYSLHISSCLLIAALTVASGQIYASTGTKNSWKNKKPFAFQLVPSGTNHLSYITTARVVVFVATAICILAVDFTVYPRRFAKAETYGFGLMDIGVGAFVLSNAVVSQEARTSSSENRRNFGSLSKAVASSIPILILGLGRILSTSAVNYHEHVSEYGRHWNFFFTLAATKISSSVVFMIFPPSYSGFLAVLIGVLQQCFLSLGLRNWVFHNEAPRDSLIEANREGLASCLGYLSIYLAGVQLGRLFCRANLTLIRWIQELPRLVLYVALLGLLVYLSHTFVEPVSRRMANITYIVWMVTFYAAFLVMFLMIDLVVVSYQYAWNIVDRPTYSQPSTISQAVNYNTLLCFLMANLMTGFVNLSIKTLYCTAFQSMLILFSYMFILMGAMVVLFSKKIHIKYW